MCCLDTIIQIGDQCHSDPVLARVQAMGLPAEKSAWQHGKVFFSVQPASEFGITDGGLWPKVKPRVWLSDRQVSMQRFEHMTEFFTVSLPVNSDVTLVTPGSDTGELVVYWHGAAMVRPVLQKGFQNVGIAGDKTGAQAKQVGSF